MLRGMTEIIAGKYEVLETIGRGGMGTVYKALQRNLDRIVAIKMLSEELAADPEFRARFQQEATIIARLNHPNIVAVHDIEPHHHTFCIIMEYLEGETLQAKIDRDVSLPEREALSIGAQVARALHYAHDHGIIHRDIKPDNIHISPQGVTKVMDFGIARFLQSKLKTQTGISMGTPKFMSPEQVTGKNMDGQTDLYSLGICLYVALCGRVPFDGENAITIATRHLYEPPEPPSQINPAITPGAEKVVLKALEKAKGDRYRDGAEMASAIETVLNARSSVRLSDEAAREMYSGATQKMTSVSGAGAISARAGNSGTSSSQTGGQAVALSTPTGIHRLGDVVSREQEAARQQVRASTISTTGVPQLEEDDFPVLEDEDEAETSGASRRFAYLSRRLWPTAVAMLLVLAAAAYFLFGDQTAVPIPGTGGAVILPTLEAEYLKVSEQVEEDARSGQTVQALERLTRFQTANPAYETDEVKEKIARLKAALPVTAKSELAKYRAARGNALLKTPENLQVALVYLDAAKALNDNQFVDMTSRSAYEMAKEMARGNASRPRTDGRKLEDELRRIAKARQGKDTAAEEQALLWAADLDPENAVRWEELGDHYRDENYRDDARVMYTRARSLAGEEDRRRLNDKLQALEAQPVEL